MCGLFAYFGSQISPEHVLSATDVIAHRGPDDEGCLLINSQNGEHVALGGEATPRAVWYAPFPYAPQRMMPDGFLANAALAHRRLSIIDLSPTGHQPMSTTDRRYWIVYNGEIYNHDEIRRELEGEGCLFVSRSDTEVILQAFRRWGRDALHRFNGMFAFVIADLAERTFFAARDRFGVKPLYWWRSPDGELAFASEIKQFTVLPGWRATLNRQRAYDYLNWGVFDHTDETLFSGVHQLRGGECMSGTLEHNCATTIERWYDFPAVGIGGDPAKEFRRIFTDAVRLRLRSDVPVGSCLSGGLDSSAIVCVAHELLKAQGGGAGQNTFSACANERRYDERHFAESVVEATSAAPHYLYPEADALLEELDDLTWHQDEPFGSTSIYAQWCVFRAAAQSGVKVMLDGQGADEQLAGYQAYHAAYLAELLAGGRLSTLLEEYQALSRHQGLGVKFLLKALLNRLLPAIFLQRLRRFSGADSARPEWLDLERLGVIPQDPFATGRVMSGAVAVLSREQMLRTHLPMLLHWEDRDSMAHSVESRVPFLDFRLAEFLAGLPSEKKIRGGVTKYVLREAMRGLMPEMVRTRGDKMGFVTPEETWVRYTHTDWFRSRIAEAVMRSDGILRPELMESFERIVVGRSPFSFLPWRVVSFGAWLKRFDVAI